MNELQIFENSEFGSVRTITINNEPWFVAADVATALGYATARDAIARYCKGGVRHDTPTSSGIQSISYINEGDMYCLIMRSKLPSAEKFEDWVVGEVLPPQSASMECMPKMNFSTIPTCLSAWRRS